MSFGFMPPTATATCRCSVSVAATRCDEWPAQARADTEDQLATPHEGREYRSSERPRNRGGHNNAVRPVRAERPPRRDTGRCDLPNVLADAAPADLGPCTVRIAR